MITPKAFHCKKPGLRKTGTNKNPSKVLEWIVLGYEAFVACTYTTNSDHKDPVAYTMLLGYASCSLTKEKTLQKTEYVALHCPNFSDAVWESFFYAPDPCRYKGI